MDPILEEDLKRSRKIKQYQQIQKYQEEIQKADKIENTGQILGKKVKKLSSDNALTGFFKRLIK